LLLQHFVISDGAVAKGDRFVRCAEPRSRLGEEIERFPRQPAAMLAAIRTDQLGGMHRLAGADSREIRAAAAAQVAVALESH